MTSESFSKNQRLILKKDFEFMKTGCSRIREDSVLFVYKNSRIADEGKSNALNRLGIIVSKKNGNAVRRNKIKRIIRENFRKSFLRETKDKFDFLIIINSSKNEELISVSRSIELSFSHILKKFRNKIINE